MELSPIHLEYLIFHNCTNSEHEHDSQMWLTVEQWRKGGGGSMWSKSIHYSQWFQPLICLMWYDILPRWLLVSFIHINEHHQLAEWDKFPPSFLVLRQWNLVAIINQGQLSILTCLNQPHQNYVHWNLILFPKMDAFNFWKLPPLFKWML